MLNLVLMQENAKEGYTEIPKARNLMVKSVPDLSDGCSYVSGNGDRKGENNLNSIESKKKKNGTSC